MGKSAATNDARALFQTLLSAYSATPTNLKSLSRRSPPALLPSIFAGTTQNDALNSVYQLFSNRIKSPFRRVVGERERNCGCVYMCRYEVWDRGKKPSDDDSKCVDCDDGGN